MDGDDRDLVARRDFEALYDRHHEWVASLAFRLTGDRDAALDVVQETFVYLHRKIPALELRCSLKTLLYPVVKHLSLSRRRQSRRTVALEPDAFAAPPDPATQDLVSLLGDLPETHQEVVRLRFVDGLDLAGIAAALGIPVGTVKSRLHTALEHLRRRAPNR